MATQLILLAFVFLFFSCGEEAAVKGNRTTEGGENNALQTQSPQNKNTSETGASQGENAGLNTTLGSEVQPGNGYPSKAGNLDDTATEHLTGIQPGKTAAGSAVGQGKINPKRIDQLNDTASEAPASNKQEHNPAGARLASDGQYPSKANNLDDTASENGSRSPSSPGSTSGSRIRETTGAAVRINSNSKQGLEDTASENKLSSPLRTKVKNATIPSRKG